MIENVSWDRLCKWLVLATAARVFGADLLTSVHALTGV